MTRSRCCRRAATCDSSSATFRSVWKCRRAVALEQQLLQIKTTVSQLRSHLTKNTLSVAETTTDDIMSQMIDSDDPPAEE